MEAISVPCFESPENTYGIDYRGTPQVNPRSSAKADKQE
jgi:hypothetical protein